MRVRVTEDTRTYWAYAIQELREGDELNGEFARHLVEIAAPVEILDGAPEEPLQPPGPDGGPGPDGAEGGSTEGADGSDTEDGAPAQELPAPAGEQPPVDGTIDTLMTWIAGDKDRAVAALAAEQARDKPRSTVVTRLAALTAE